MKSLKGNEKIVDSAAKVRQVLTLLGSANERLTDGSLPVKQFNVYVDPASIGSIGIFERVLATWA